MRISLKLAALFLGSAGALSATPAMAGCGDVAGVKPSSWQGGGTPLLKLADWDRDRMPPIVGLWSTQFVGTNGQIVDFGYAEWHADGTEILNSATHAPNTQNFCLGTWAQVAPNRYKLNHFALSYVPNTATIAVIVNIREDVTVAGDSYGGSFSIQAYNPTSKQPMGPATTGHVTGKRITINSGV